MRRFLFVFPLLLCRLAVAEAPPEAKEIDSLWKERDLPGVMPNLEAKTNALLAAHPNDFEALWRAARLKRWQSDGETDKAKKMQEGKEAWALGDRTVKANPKAVEGYYYGALGIGSYSQGAGILKALGEGLESKFNERLDTAIKINPDYESGGGLVAKGRYWYELPWPKRNLGKSEQVLNQAIAKHPENLRAYVYLAETLLKDDKPDQARAALAKALSGPVDYDPPEGRRAKAMAAEVQKELK